MALFASVKMAIQNVKMAKFLSFHQSQHVKFHEASFDLLSDFIVNLNKTNRDKLNNLTKGGGHVPDHGLIEYIFLITEELRLEPSVAYHATELLERSVIKHLKEPFATHTPQGAAATQLKHGEDHVFKEQKEKFPLIVFTCVQLASKFASSGNRIDNNTAVHFLRSAGLSVSKQAVMESELKVLKGLEFRLSVPNPLVYVEIFLEVLGHNDSPIPVEHLYHQCCHVLQFACLQKAAIYDSLLRFTTQCASPSGEQREKFATVTQDFMLLGAVVIAVASYIQSVDKWEQVVKELNYITGISQKSIKDFAHVTLMHITKPSST